MKSNETTRRSTLVSVSPDATRAAFLDSSLRNLFVGQEFGGKSARALDIGAAPRFEVISPLWSPDGKFIVAGTLRTVYVVDAKTLRVLRRFSDRSYVSSVGWRSSSLLAWTLAPKFDIQAPTASFLQYDIRKNQVEHLRITPGEDEHFVRGLLDGRALLLLVRERSSMIPVPEVRFGDGHKRRLSERGEPEVIVQISS